MIGKSIITSCREINLGQYLHIYLHLRLILLYDIVRFENCKWQKPELAESLKLKLTK